MAVLNDNEKGLLLQLAAGDDAAFQQIYFLYSRRLYGNLLKLVKSEVIAQEILQDAFIKIWEYRSNIDPEKSFRSYLFRIAENMVCNFYSKASRDKALLKKLIESSANEYSHVEEAVMFREESKLLHAAIEELPPQRRQVFKLCKIEGKTYHEVGSLLNISVSTVSDHIVKANRFLKEYASRKHTFILILALLLSCSDK